MAKRDKTKNIIIIGDSVVMDENPCAELFDDVTTQTSNTASWGLSGGSGGTYPSSSTVYGSQSIQGSLSWSYVGPSTTQHNGYLICPECEREVDSTADNLNTLTTGRECSCDDVQGQKTPHVVTQYWHVACYDERGRKWEREAQAAYAELVAETLHRRQQESSRSFR